MKSLAELKQLREEVQGQIDLRKEHKEGVRVVIGMATCGIAAGARPVMNAFLKEVSKRGLSDVTVTQTGCIGMCRMEPIVEVFMPGKEKVTYVHMTENKVARIVAEHIINKQPVTEYTIGAAKD
ncbi:MAG: (2Fe-2S) ferredoxin domain-containing protein [Bacillota bacterium]|nr:(2Fe-2S) ferredoxin domain-containing protein [Bacillota bacterium]